MRNHQCGIFSTQPFKTLVVSVVFPECRVIRSKTVDGRSERVLAFQNVLFFWSLDTLTTEGHMAGRSNTVTTRPMWCGALRTSVW